MKTDTSPSCPYHAGAASAALIVATLMGKIQPVEVPAHYLRTIEMTGP